MPLVADIPDPPSPFPPSRLAACTRVRCSLQRSRQGFMHGIETRSHHEVGGLRKVQSGRLCPHTTKSNQRTPLRRSQGSVENNRFSGGCKKSRITTQSWPSFICQLETATLGHILTPSHAQRLEGSLIKLGIGGGCLFSYPHAGRFAAARVGCAWRWSCWRTCTSPWFWNNNVIRSRIPTWNVTGRQAMSWIEWKQMCNTKVTVVFRSSRMIPMNPPLPRAAYLTLSNKKHSWVRVGVTLAFPAKKRYRESSGHVWAWLLVISCGENITIFSTLTSFTHIQFSRESSPYIHSEIHSSNVLRADFHENATKSGGSCVCLPHWLSVFSYVEIG